MITHKNDLTDYVSHNGLQQCLELLRSSQLRQAATELDLLLTNSNSVYIHNKKSCKTHTHKDAHRRTDAQRRTHQGSSHTCGSTHSHTYASVHVLKQTF